MSLNLIVYVFSRQRIGKTKLREDCNLFLGDEKKLVFDDEIPVEETSQGIIVYIFFNSEWGKEIVCQSLSFFFYEKGFFEMIRNSEH